MITEFFIEKVKQSRLRKLPLLPRLGLTVDFAGRRFCYRQVSLLETVLNLLERGPSLGNLQKIVKEELAEVQMPQRSTKRTVEVEVRTISAQQRRRKRLGV